MNSEQFRKLLTLSKVNLKILRSKIYNNYSFFIINYSLKKNGLKFNPFFLPICKHQGYIKKQNKQK